VLSVRGDFSARPVFPGFPHHVESPQSRTPNVQSPVLLEGVVGILGTAVDLTPPRVAEGGQLDDHSDQRILRRTPGTTDIAQGSHHAAVGPMSQVSAGEFSPIHSDRAGAGGVYSRSQHTIKALRFMVTRDRKLRLDLTSNHGCVQIKPERLIVV